MENEKLDSYNFDLNESNERVISYLSLNFNLKENIVRKIIELLDNDNTVPFIARYRKEETHNTSDVILRELSEKLIYLRNLEDRKNTILSNIYLKNKLSEELEKEIKETYILSKLEDLYRPYKDKKISKAKKAIEAGLEPISFIILKGIKKEDFSSYLESFINIEKGYKNKVDVLNGAKDIIKEKIGDDYKIRTFIKDNIFKYSLINVYLNKSLLDIEKSNKYKVYIDFKCKINKLKPYQILAIFRAKKEEILDYDYQLNKEKYLEYILYPYVNRNNIYLDIINECSKESLSKIILPSLINEINNDLFSFAEDKSIIIFKKNLKELLLYPPLKNKKVLGVDPAFRTGVKYAYVDSLSIPHEIGVVYLTSSKKEDINKGKEELSNLIKKYNIEYIALGNGTASRETLSILEEMKDEYNLNIKIYIVNESGASVYSASKIGESEFPSLSVEKRSAISLARRVIDPLAELVKIDPKSIGIGQYQHDMNESKLNDALYNVVEDSVNLVGVNLNTSSVSLLSYVSGINKTLANNIYNYRLTHGNFLNRNELKNVKMMGEKAFTQCAGFLKIEDGNEILDKTMIHPERYNEARLILSEINLNLNSDNKETRIAKIDNFNKEKFLNEHKDMIKETLLDILNELKNPGRDIRDEMDLVKIDNNVKSIDDLKVGMILNGTIHNIMDFGLFVDINIHLDGLVHISEISNEYVKDISSLYKINDIVKVKVISIDKENNRIGLSIKKVNE